MSEPGHNSGVAREQLRAIVERIERIETDIADMNSDKRDIYAEAKANGFDTKVLKKVVADRRKDASERQEFEAIYDLYAAALGMIPAFEPQIDVHVNRPEFPNDFSRAQVHALEAEIPNPATNLEGDGERPSPSPDAQAQKAGDDPVGLVGESPVLDTLESGQQDAANPQDRNEPVSGAAAIATPSLPAEMPDIPQFMRRNKEGA